MRIFSFLGVLYAPFLNPALAEEKIPTHVYEAAQRFMDSINIFPVSSYETASGIPMRIAIQKGALDIVGDVWLKLYIGSCLNEKDKKLLLKLLSRSVARQHPNCKLYARGYQCLQNSPSVKTICELRMDKNIPCPPKGGISEMLLELKCILPLRGMNVFFTEEKVYF